MKTLFSFLFLLLLTPVASAEERGVTTAGDYTVYYTVFPSSFLQPDVAGAYNLVRAKDRYILNVSVRKRLGDNKDREHSAIVSGTRSDLIHKLPLKFTEVREQGAVYYLAEVRVSTAEKLYFKLSVQPDPNQSPIIIEFQKQVFPDE